MRLNCAPYNRQRLLFTCFFFVKQWACMHPVITVTYIWARHYSLTVSSASLAYQKLPSTWNLSDNARVNSRHSFFGASAMADCIQRELYKENRRVNPLRSIWFHDIMRVNEIRETTRDPGCVRCVGSIHLLLPTVQVRDVIFLLLQFHQMNYQNLKLIIVVVL